MEFVRASGLRIDGRRGTEIRSSNCKLGIVADCDGSSRWDQGLTSVIVEIRGPREARSSTQTSHDRAIIRCDVFQAAFSTLDRRVRRTGDKRSLTLSRTIEDTFSNVIQTSLFPKTQIDVSIYILQSDGGLLSTCLNATTAALLDAGIPMIDMIASCSIGYLDDTLLLDLNHQEEHVGGPELTLTLLPKTSQILSVNMGSKSTRVNAGLLDQLVKEATRGCHLVHTSMLHQCRDYLETKLEKMNIEL